MAYDITEAFEDIEMALIESMRNNMKRHINDEYDEGINWTQWQAEMLHGLSQYRAENADVLKGYMGRMNAQLDGAIRDAYTTGESEQEIALLNAIKAGYKPSKGDSGTNMQGTFFRSNQRKLNALIKATTNDMKKAESAMLRMQDDVYRQTIFKAQMFYNTGAGGMWKCVDMATKDFLAAGYNCVEYKNGARVNIASYSEMALRTANKRANMMGAANFREKHGMHLVKINARGTACPLCLPFLGKVFVDDVYGAGTYEESASTGYPLLSNAVKAGLFHPNCKDSCSTFYEGINQPSKAVTPEQEKEINRRYQLEQQQRYYERNYRKNLRLANGSLTEEDIKVYSERARTYKSKLIDLCDNHSDVLRLDKQRLNLRGVLTVDGKGKISVKGSSTSPTQAKKRSIPKASQEHSDAYNKLVERLDYVRNKADLEYRPVEELGKKLTSSEIVQRLAGGDLTSGSCSSLGLAYAGNRNGLNVLDFRGGESRSFFASKYNIDTLAQIVDQDKVFHETARAWATAGNRLLKKVEEGKEYYFVCGRHAAIVRRIDGALQYLELQSGWHNGWHAFDGNPRYTLAQRFGCRGSQGYDVDVFMIDIDAFAGNEEFADILGYINTAADKQKKGDGGFEK